MVSIANSLAKIGRLIIASPGKYTGPLHWNNRYFTVAEYKRIQGFPDEHLFYGDRSAQIRQIGNSVCPKIAYYMALAIREQIFGVPSGITYLQPTDVLSFDMRKGRKAQSTKALHQAVLEKSKNNPTDIFQLFEFEDHVTPTLSKKHNNMKVTRTGNAQEKFGEFGADRDKSYIGYFDGDKFTVREIHSEIWSSEPKKKSL